MICCTQEQNQRLRTSLTDQQQHYAAEKLHDQAKTGQLRQQLAAGIEEARQLKERVRQLVEDMKHHEQQSHSLQEQLKKEQLAFSGLKGQHLEVEAELTTSKKKLADLQDSYEALQKKEAVNFKARQRAMTLKQKLLDKQEYASRMEQFLREQHGSDFVVAIQGTLMADMQAATQETVERKVTAAASTSEESSAVNQSNAAKRRRESGSSDTSDASTAAESSSAAAAASGRSSSATVATNSPSITELD